MTSHPLYHTEQRSLWYDIHFTLRTARQASLSITNSWSPPKPTSIESVMPSVLKAKRISLVAQMVKNLPAMQETKVQFLGQKDPLKGMAAAAAAKSLQSCPTLCDPLDVSPPGSPVSRILQARTLEWVAISFSNEWKWKVKVKSLSRVWLWATPWTAAYQAPPSTGFSRKE